MVIHSNKALTDESDSVNAGTYLQVLQCLARTGFLACIYSMGNENNYHATYAKSRKRFIFIQGLQKGLYYLLVLPQITIPSIHPDV